MALLPASQRFAQIVNETMRARDISYNEAWRFCQRTHPAEYAAMEAAPTGHSKAVARSLTQAPKPQLSPAGQKFTRLVQDMANERGVSWNTAWDWCKAKHPDLYQEMANVKAPKVETSADGQMLYGQWPVPPEVLMEMRLPQNVSQEQYHLYRAAARALLTPEIAAYVVRALVQFSQIHSGKSYDEAMGYAQQYLPVLYKTALKAERK